MNEDSIEVAIIRNRNYLLFWIWTVIIFFLGVFLGWGIGRL